MLRISILLLPSFILGTLSISPIVDFQEQFSELSRSIEPQLCDYRAENRDIRSKVALRSLEALAKLTTEMRNVTWDTWARIEAHELATPECLERVRVEFDYYVFYGGANLQTLGGLLHWYLYTDGILRFNPVAWQVQRENSQAIYQTVQTLGRNQFLDNMPDTVHELQYELDHYKTLWTTNQERLQEQLVLSDYMVNGVEDNIEMWHEFTLRRHRFMMENLYNSLSYRCPPMSVAEKAKNIGNKRNAETH